MNNLLNRLRRTDWEMVTAYIVVAVILVFLVGSFVLNRIYSLD
jgi:biotin transporter BioY